MDDPYAVNPMLKFGACVMLPAPAEMRTNFGFVPEMRRENMAWNNTRGPIVLTYIGVNDMDSV